LPIYAYRCAECGKDFEVLAKIADAAPTRGPGCDGSACQLAKRLMPVVGHVSRSGGASAYREQAMEAAASYQVPRPEGGGAHVCTKYCDHHKKT
jgi:putative FmdB family regulatory protein